MESSYAEKHQDKIIGLILLGSCPVNKTVVPTITIYGSNAMVFDKQNLYNTKNTI